MREQAAAVAGLRAFIQLRAPTVARLPIPTVAVAVAAEEPAASAVLLPQLLAAQAELAA